MSLKVQQLHNSTDNTSANGLESLNGSSNGNSNVNGKVEAIVSKVIPPEIPHVSMNMTPLNLILKRQSIYTFKQLKEFLKSLESNSQSDNLKKKQFLELLVQFRENFIRLYVLCKWSRNSKSVEKLIDLFVWLREQNQVITNAILYLGTLKQSLVTAKMPEPDLSTALEVLTQGRPQLPTYNYVKTNPLRPELILKTLKYLNVELSTRMALQENLPKLFHNYVIKDGRVTFRVPNSFNCSISINDDTPNSKFFLIDFKLGFELKDNHLIPSTKSLNSSTFHRLELLANKELSINGLQGLFKLLYNYSATCKLYLLHRQLIQLRMGLWRSHLSHTYNAEKSFITITYWIQKRSTPSTIEIGKFDTGTNKSNELNFKWNKEGIIFNDHNLKLINDNGIIDIEDLIRKIIEFHIELNINQTKKNLNNTVENVDKFVTISNNNKIILGVSQTKDVIYSIDSLSGHCYFENPTELMNLIAFKINNDPRLDYIELLRLRLETQLNEISSKLNATGWLKVNSIKLNQEEILKLDVNYEYLKDKNLSSRLLDIKVYKRKEWPVGWFLMIGVSGYSSKIQIWCSRIKSYQGQWLVNWSNKLDVINKDLTISYSNLLDLVKLCSSKLISNLIVKELEDKGCKIHTMDLNDLMIQKFIEKNFDIIIDENDNDKSDHDNKLSLDENKSDNSIIMIKNKSLYNIQNSRDALILIISIKNGNLKLSIFGKLILDNKIPVINFVDENKSSVNYNPETKIFKVESKIDLTDKFSDRKISTLSSTLSSSLPTKTTSNAMMNSTTTTNINSNINNGLLDLNGSIKTTSNDSIMFNTLSILRKLSSLLGLLQLITKDNSLKIQNISLDSISFQYGELFEESITLKISHNQNNSIEIELPKDNPHQNCIQYLNKLVSTDDFNFLKIKELVTYLKLTLNFYKTFISLKDNQKLLLKEFNESNQEIDLDKGEELKVLPEQGFNLNLFSFEILRIMYFKTIKLDKKKNQTAKAELYKLNLKIELRHRINKLSLIHSQYLISIDERTESSGTIMEGRLKNFADQFFTGNTQIPVSIKDGNIVYLKSSICCNYKCVGEVVFFLHEKLKDIVYV